MKKQLYLYEATVTGVYDGDTITVNIDLGLTTSINGEKIRLYRINTPEVRGPEKPEGIKARDFLRGLILDKKIVIETIKDKKGKYGRYLGEIHLQLEDGSWLNINDHLVKNGFAEYKSY